MLTQVCAHQIEVNENHRDVEVFCTGVLAQAGGTTNIDSVGADLL